MKKIHLLNLSVIIILVISLSGCVIYEQLRLQIDLLKMTGQIEYFNVVSAIEKKESYWQTEKEKEDFFKELDQIRKADLKELLNDYNPDSIRKDSNVYSKRLVSSNGKLNGIEKFKLSSLEKFDISMNLDGTKYRMKLDDGCKYINSNGLYIETDSGKYVEWNSSVKKVDVTIKLCDLEKDFDYVESMLKYWEEWQQSN